MSTPRARALSLLLTLAAGPQAAAVGQPAAAEPPVAPPETPAALAARLAARQLPRARWRVGEARTADFTYDGVADLALMGVDGAAFVLAVVEGPVTERSRVLLARLPSGGEAPGPLCGPPAAVQVNTERPDASGLTGLDAGARERIEDGAEAGGLGFVVVHASSTGYCQAVHLLYDGARLAWWRATEPS